MTELMMTPTDFFDTLGAPLKNVRWSWGARREQDGTVFLRVWQDEMEISDGSRYVRLTNSQKAENYKEQNQGYKPGYQERREHIELIKNGAKCYLIMCEAVNDDAAKRQIKDFDKDRLFPAGKVMQRNDDWWAELLPPVPVRQVKLS